MSDPAAHVLQIAKQVLDVDSFDPKSNFFELGGDSLTAVNFVRLIEEELSIEIPLVEFFEAPDLATFAEFVATVDSSVG